jgi:hypothetical protein
MLSTTVPEPSVATNERCATEICPEAVVAVEVLIELTEPVTVSGPSPRYPAVTCKAVCSSVDQLDVPVDGAAEATDGAANTATSGNRTASSDPKSLFTSISPLLERGQIARTVPPDIGISARLPLEHRAPVSGCNE